MVRFLAIVTKASIISILVLTINTLNLMSLWLHVHPDIDHHGHIHHSHFNLSSIHNTSVNKESHNIEFNNIPVNHILVNPDGYLYINFIREYKFNTYQEILQFSPQHYNLNPIITHREKVHPLKCPIYNPLKEFYQTKTNLSPPYC